MGRGVHRARDGGTSGSSGRSFQGRSSGTRGGSHSGMDAPIGEGTRARPSSSRDPPSGGDDPTGQSSRLPRRIRTRRPIRLIDEDDDDDVPTSPLAAARPQSPPPAAPEPDTMAYMEQIMDECPDLPPLPPRGGNRLTRSTPLTKHGNDLFHHTTDRVLDPRMPRQMALSIQGRISGVWPSWKFVPGEVKNLMCSEWMELYDFRGEDLPRARNAFMSNAPDLYKQLMKRIRDKAKKLMEREDYVDDGTSGRPEWMAADVWEGLCRDHWSSETWRRASSTNRSNRLKTKDDDITRHTGGSVSVEIHEGRLAKELGRAPTFYDVFERTHRTDQGKGAYKDKKSEGVAERYLQQMQAQYGDDVATYPELDVDAYRIAAGAPNRGICYGLGSTTQSALRLPDSGGSSRESRASQSTSRAPHSTPSGGVMTDPDLVRRLEVIEARFHEPVQSVVDPTQLESLVRGVVQVEVESMRAGFMAQVNTDLERTLKSQSDRFIAELRASEERQKKQLAARDNSLIMAMMKTMSARPSSSHDDDTVPPDT